jgi:hypothetical protein
VCNTVRTVQEGDVVRGEEEGDVVTLGQIEFLLCWASKRGWRFDRR